MNNPKVSFVIATYNRKDDLCETLNSILDQTYSNYEIVVVCNSDDDTPELFLQDGPFDREEIRYFHYPERMGVSKARNTGIQKATGDIIITIDDDAVLDNPDVTTHVIDAFAKDSDIGVVAFRSENYFTGEVARKEFPDPPFNQRSPDEEFETTFFVGVGNAIRADVFQKVNCYAEDFEYGVEELDLSLRIVDDGWRIKYDPRACVRHKESPEGRLPNQEVIAKILENRIRTTVRNLPWRYVVVSSVIWSVYTLAQTSGDPRPVLLAIFSVISAKDDLLSQRGVLDRQTIRYIKKMSGPLYWWWMGTPPQPIFCRFRLSRIR